MDPLLVSNSQEVDGINRIDGIEEGLDMVAENVLRQCRHHLWSILGMNHHKIIYV
jgi:hypothetical protein